MFGTIRNFFGMFDDGINAARAALQDASNSWNDAIEINSDPSIVKARKARAFAIAQASIQDDLAKARKRLDKISTEQAREDYLSIVNRRRIYDDLPEISFEKKE